MFSIILWSAFPILAPGLDNTKVYCISPVGYNRRCGRGQERGKLNCRGRLRAASTSFIIVKKILIMISIVVVI
jgi:hypothetical protein